MDLEGLIILTDDQTVADAAEIGPQGHEVNILLGLPHHIYGIESEGDLFLRHHVKVGLFLVGILRLAQLRHGLAPELCQHTLQNQQIALAAGVHHTGLFQNRIHIRGLR